jgi:hypothetical protein
MSTTVNVTVGIDPTSSSTTGFSQNNAYGSGQNFGSIDSDSLPGVGTIDSIILVTPFGYPVENLFIAIDGGVNGPPAADAFYNVEFTDGAGTKFTVLANTYTNYYTQGTIAGWTFFPDAAIWTSGAVEPVTFNVTAPPPGPTIYPTGGTTYNYTPTESSQVLMRYSDDGGMTWSNWTTERLGAIGNYGTIARFRSLGFGRNRVFQIRVTDPIYMALIGATLDITRGQS